MIPGCAEYSVGSRVVAGNVSAAALRSEVVNDDESILRMKGQGLEAVRG
jgi:hypothetical protein